MKRNSIKDRDVKNKSINISPLDQRESKMDTRKGMPKVKCEILIDSKDYKQIVIDWFR
jgi:hypothetical protein